jgi:hypothetical protein
LKVWQLQGTTNSKIVACFFHKFCDIKIAEFKFNWIYLHDSEGTTEF